MDNPWWKEAVVYQIYPRSFCDTDGDGVGDLEGVRAHLDHLVWLGVDAIWLSPIFPSPMADHGYDVADYCDIDPLFGDLEGFDRLLADAHDRGLRVLLDWVPNHTSDQHPWFLESRSSRDNPKRDWYIWVDGDPDTPPTSWQSFFPPAPAWSWDETTNAWYLRQFAPEQPDLDWSNPEVEAAMHDTLRFWLDRGVDGFRIDVVHLLGKDRRRITQNADSLTDPARTHELLRRIRGVIDSYEDRMAVGEVFILDTQEVATYYGDGDELHLAFNFRPQFTEWEAPKWREQVDQAMSAHDPIDAWPTWVIGNHDIPRPRTRYGSDEIARAAVVTLLSLRGTPFLYAGDELGLEDAEVPEDMVQDPAGFRDGCRAPIPWDDTDTHGWIRTDNWLPWPPDPSARSVQRQREDDDSILHLTRRMLGERLASPALRHGDQVLLDTPPEVVGWKRSTDGETRVTLVCFSEAPVEVPGFDGHSVTIASDGVGEGQSFGGTLGSWRAVVLSQPS